MKTDNVKIEITLKSLVLITAFVVGVVVAWQLRLVFMFLLFAFIINSALRPYVDYFQTRKIPRIVSTLFIYISLLLVFSIMAVTLFSETIEQLKNLVMLMPQLIANILAELFVIFPWLKEIVDLQEFRTEFIRELTGFVGSLGGGLLGAYTIINSAVTSLGGAVTVIMLSIYMLVRKREVYLSAINFLPIKEESKKSYIERLKLVEDKLGDWVRAQLFVMVFIGVLTWFGLVTPAAFFDSYNMNQYALPIAFIAGILEAVPTLGPVLTAIIAVVIALGSGSSFAVVIYVVLLFYLIQQLESSVIFPNLMAKVVGVDPIITIVSVIGAYIIFGILGAIFIVPLIAVARILISPEISNLVHNNNNKESSNKSSDK